MNVAVNPGWQIRYKNDETARLFILQRCGKLAAEAYTCFVAPAYRADLFRYCAMCTPLLAAAPDACLLEPASRMVLPRSM